MCTNRRLCFHVAILAASCCLFGCTRYKPKNYVPPNVFKSQYLADVTAKTLLKDYNDMDAPTPTPDTPEAVQQRQAKANRRNQILIELVALIDQNYSVFEDRYYGSEALVNFGGDVANLGLTGVSSVTGTAHLKSVLSAIATGTTGIKTSYEKNFFDQQTRSAVVQQMRAGRATQLALIQDQDHMKAPVVCPAAGCPTVPCPATGCPAAPGAAAPTTYTVAPYSLETGLSDIEKYYQEGTLIGALQAIAVSAGKTQTDASTKQKVNSATQQIF
jgi:hypothetical protein